MMAYIYQSGSEFETVMNAYMSGFKALKPNDVLQRAIADNTTSSTT